MGGASKWTVLLGAVALAGCGGGSKTMGGGETFEQKQVQCTIDGEVQTRMTRDCSTELSYQERRIGARLELLGQKLGGESDVQFRPVKSSLTLLLEQQRGLCRDWNACALSRQEYVQRSEWLTSQFTTLSQLLDSADPATMNDDDARQRLVDEVLAWAERARSRQAQARLDLDRVEVESDRVHAEAERNEIEAERTDAAQATAGAARVEAGAEQVQAGAQGEIAGNEQRKAGGSERVASALEGETEAMRRAFEEQQGFEQQMVEQQEQIQQRVRQRLQTALEQQQDRAQSLEKLIAVLAEVRKKTRGAGEGRAPAACGDQRLLGRLDALADSEIYATQSQAENVQEPLSELCESFAAWRQPNERLRLAINRFFAKIEKIEGWMKERADRDPPDGPDARRALRVLENLRQQTLRGVEEGRRPFPCFSEHFTRIAEMEWKASVPRAQMPGLESAAERVCGAVDLDEEGLEDNVDDLESRLDSAESSARRTLRSTQANIQRLETQVR